jgi:hypothetical protein
LTDAERRKLQAACWDLPPDALALLGRVAPLLRPLRLKARNDAIRHLAASHYVGLARRAKASAIAQDLDRLQSVAARSGHLAGQDGKRGAVANVLALNDGQSISWRRLFDILD